MFHTDEILEIWPDLIDSYEVHPHLPFADLDIPFELQRFAAEDEGRTEAPSERRRREERDKGNVAKSPELPASIVLLAGVGILYLLGDFFFKHSFLLFRKYLMGLSKVRGFGQESLQVLLKDFATDILYILFPLLGITVVAAILGNLVQVGFLFSPRALNPNFGRIRPNFKRVLPTRQTLFNLAKSIAKVALIGWVSYIIISQDFSKVLLAGDMGLKQAMSLIATTAFKVFIVVSILLLAIGIADYFYQRFEYEESLKMTKQEAKQETKEQEGDPTLQSRRRQLGRDIINQRQMLSNVPEADVVITNPTHYAVALRFDNQIHEAPEVIAKGVDEFALLIIRIAKENGIPTVENRVQARMLYEEVEIGDQIPAKFYQAVSQILSRLDSFRRKAGV